MNQTLQELQSLLHPFYCSEKIRVGSKYDGGYVLPEKALVKSDCLLSFGVSTNIDFEVAFASRNKKASIYMSDPFIGPFEDFGRLLKRVFNGKQSMIKRNINLEPNLNLYLKKNLFLRNLY